MFESWKEKWHRRKIEKIERLRRKNAKLRAQGKEPIKKGWGKMINTGFGGLNKTNGSDIDQMKETLYRKNEIEEIARKKEEKSKNKSDI